jgi:rubredoxin-NAD+ reductase
MDSIIIIGTGLAGYSLAREFRRLDQITPLLIITEDDGRSYSKPMLSNALAQGKDAAKLTLADAEAMAQTLQAQILTHTQVTGIDSHNRTVLTRQGSHTYSSLVFAMGARPIRLPIKGDGAEDVLSVNNLGDYAHFREKLEQAQSIAIIGPGLIGCEFANDLLQVNKAVTLIGPDPYPISTLLPESAGTALQSTLQKAGVDWRLGSVVDQIDKLPNGYRLLLSNGDQLEADLVLSAVGLRPNIGLAAETGIATNRGIVTDRNLQTSMDRIYALGDCAEVDGLNLPYVAPLMIGARALARTLAGTPTAVEYPAMPVVIKTPACPIVAAPPPRSAEGEWEINAELDNITALFRSADGQLQGFVLTGTAVSQKQALTKQLPALLA